MSMMCPPQSVKIVSTPSFLSALATRGPPDTSAASLLLGLRVSSAVVEVPALGAVTDAVVTAFMLPPASENVASGTGDTDRPAAPGHGPGAVSSHKFARYRVPPGTGWAMPVAVGFSSWAYLIRLAAKCRTRIGLRMNRPMHAASTLKLIAITNTVLQPCFTARAAANGTNSAPAPLAV